MAFSNKKKWKIIFSEPLGDFGNKFEMDDWAEIHRSMPVSPVMMETKVIKAIRKAAESRTDYSSVKRQFQITDKDGKTIPSESCVFLFLKDADANLQLLLRHVKQESRDYYEILAVGDNKLVDFIHRLIPQAFMSPTHMILRYIDKRMADASPKKTAGLLIHEGKSQTPETKLYLATSDREKIL